MGEIGYSAVERVGARPTLEIHGIQTDIPGKDQNCNPFRSIGENFYAFGSVSDS